MVTPPDPTLGHKFALPGENVGSIGADTWDRNRKVVKLFAEFVGETAHVSSITRKAVRDWKHKLASWPRKAGDIKAFDGLSFRKIVEANLAAGRPTISQNTINKYLSALGTFAEWLLHNEFNETDVMRGMYLELDKRAKTRFPYDAEQLKTIFRSPLLWPVPEMDRNASRATNRFGIGAR
jgi:site-specific recombinase XerD